MFRCRQEQLDAMRAVLAVRAIKAHDTYYDSGTFAEYSQLTHKLQPLSESGEARGEDRSLRGRAQGALCPEVRCSISSIPKVTVEPHLPHVLYYTRDRGVHPPSPGLVQRVYQAPIVVFFPGVRYKIDRVVRKNQTRAADALPRCIPVSSRKDAYVLAPVAIETSQ